MENIQKVLWPSKTNNQLFFSLLCFFFFLRYHVPRAFLKPKGNLLVLFEEHDGNPQNILITTVECNNICTCVSGQRDPTIKDAKPKALLTCPDEMVIEEIVFASFGNPEGFCGNFTIGSCHSPHARIVAEKVNWLYTVFSNWA